MEQLAANVRNPFVRHVRIGGFFGRRCVEVEATAGPSFLDVLDDAVTSLDDDAVFSLDDAALRDELLDDPAFVDDAAVLDAPPGAPDEDVTSPREAPDGRGRALHALAASGLPQYLQETCPYIVR